ncbi:FAD-containing monooxygenase EthA [Acrasis kona]|uniref:FAD-containing monooxygenase EthA n=1 Tax=Acrasis kona TaxID=1008807 RepID=A0AAW2Z6G0_9EUKA
MQSFDVVIVGAGISGINAGYRVKESTNKTFTILEARGSLGGTWDLFKYPGIRSDSDLHTFGFPFHPWTNELSIADGASIKKYIKDTAEYYGIDKHINYHHKLVSANWSSQSRTWTLDVDTDAGKKKICTKFLVIGTGYYDYNKGLEVEIPGIQNFEGKVVHPQFWPEDLDYKDKNVLIIGSGATAVTLLPNIAKESKMVTMLQRSPTYIMPVESIGSLKKKMRKYLPLTWTYQILRFLNLFLSWLIYFFCMTFPEAAKKRFLKIVASELPKDYPIAPNFDPSYFPWQQRVCATPDGDFYQAIREGKAEVVTAHIKNITNNEVQLVGTEQVLRPDIIVTATGLKIQLAGGAKVFVDDVEMNLSDKHLWKGVMVEDIPNASMIIGYANASWTLGSDATSHFIVRMLKKMDKEGISQAVPRYDYSAGMKDRPVLDLNSTYIKKGALPKCGDKGNWVPRSTYLRDLYEAKYGNITTDLQLSYNK